MVKTSSRRSLPWRPVVMPPLWKESPGPFGLNGFEFEISGLQVLASEDHIDGKRYVHLSLSLPDRLPSWYDVRLVKRDFIGPDKEAVQVLPPEEEYVNCHPYCLHLWHCLDGRIAPSLVWEED